MVADEPGGWELKRALEQHRTDMREGFAELNKRLDKVVSADAFAAEQRRVDDRHKDLQAGIAAEAAARQSALDREREERKAGDAAQQVALDKLTTTQRWVAAAIVLPIALFVITVFINLSSAAK